MLSSTADNLYWMGRYIERAENTARILDVSYRSSLMPHPGKSNVSDWQAALAILGEPDSFSQRYGKPTAQALITYMVFDPNNASSIFASIRAARENARALRATITTEMWESLNATWLEISDLDFPKLQRVGFREFFDWVKDRSHLFRGVTQGTMMHDDSMRFVQLGSFIERADNTARLLDTKYHMLLPEVGNVGGAVDYYQWGGLLRAVSAFRMYHQTYSDVITPARVAELLVLKPEMPRSLRFCFDRTMAIIDELSGNRDLTCRRLAGEMQARLRFGRIEDIMKRGLHDFLTDSIERIAALGDGIANDLMMSS